MIAYRHLVVALTLSAIVLSFHSSSGATIYANKTIQKLGSSATGDTSQVTVSMWARGRFDTLFLYDTLYDTTRIPLTAVLAFDLSSSMNSTDGTTRWRITWTQISALRFLDSLKQGDRVAIFGWTSNGGGLILSDTSNAARYYGKWLYLTSDINKARAYIRDSLYLDGAARLTDTANGMTLVKQSQIPGGLFDHTPLHIAIIQGLKCLANDTAWGNKAVIMLTDGENNDSVPATLVTNTIDSIHRNDSIRLFTIGFNGGDTARLRSFARTGGGSFYNAANPTQLSAIYDTLAGILVNKKSTHR